MKTCRAWKLTAVILGLVVASYLAAAYHIQLTLEFHDPWGASAVWRAYSLAWFRRNAGGWPVWLVCHLALSVACVRYYRSGGLFWGWAVALAGFVCSATGAYYLRLLAYSLGPAAL